MHHLVYLNLNSQLMKSKLGLVLVLSMLWISLCFLFLLADIQYCGFLSVALDASLVQ
uniref:Uncharacterized protein n=1 Tax=Rhizophora mucronata TaxID=61149 RepID=A0A2P2N7Q4_RHIMU